MNTFLKISRSIMVAAMVGAGAAHAELGGVREVPQMIPDLAMATFDGFGPVIYFNPVLAQQVPAGFLKFTRAHEYGHIQLGHIQREMMTANPMMRLAVARNAEIEADKFATDYWMERDPSVVEAAIRLFLSPGSANGGDHTHLPTAERARLIASWRDAHNGGSTSTGELGGRKRSGGETSTITGLRAKLREAKAAVASLERQKEQLEKEKDRLEDRWLATEGSVSDSYQRRADAVGQRIERLETRIDEANEKVSKLEEQVEDAGHGDSDSSE